jgi:hypothetical protein
MAEGPPSAENANIKVVVRCRPVEVEENIRETFDFPSDRPDVLTIKDPLSRGRMEHSYQFNKVLLPHATQEDVFNGIGKPVVDHILNGFNSCIFAYGQTGSGKTYSVFGEGAGSRRGLLPRAIEYLFERIEQRAEHREVGLVVSFLEIYLDQVRDLGKAYVEKTWKPPTPEEYPVGSARAAVRTSGLRSRPQSAQAPGSRPGSAHSGSRPASATRRQERPSSASANLQKDSAGYEAEDLEVHEAPNGQVFVRDLTLVPVKNITEVLDVVNLGVGLRQTHETRMNATSSRSHTIFTINVVQKDRRLADAEVLSGVLNFVDLAGSERLARSQSEGRRFQEAVIINSSLSTLGKVILALADRTSKYVPYRDSKLTRILTSSLGGNSYTTLLCCINPSMDNYEESLNSLQFAERCKNVQNKPTVNYVDPGKQSDDRRIRRLLAEIADLKQQLEVSKASFENKLSFMNDTLGVGGGAPEALKNVERDKQEEKGFTRSVAAAQADALRRLEAEKQKRLAAQKKADEALAKFEAAHREMAARDEERRREVIQLRDLKDKLHKELQSKHEMWGNERNRSDQEHRDNLNLEHQRCRGQLAKKDALIMDIPARMKQARLLLEEKERAWSEAKQNMVAKHQDDVDRMQLSHKDQVRNVEKQYNFWMQKKEEETASFVGEFDKYRETTTKEIKRYKEELVGLFDLVQQLTKIVTDLENGTYPTQYKCGIHQIQLPYGVKSQTPTSATFDRLFQALADCKVKCNRYMSVAASYGQEPASTADWDAVKFARDYVRTGSDTAAATLAHLGREQLGRLCSELKIISGEKGLEQEKAAVREQVLQELANHQTVAYIRHLEQELANRQPLRRRPPTVGGMAQAVS